MFPIFFIFPFFQFCFSFFFSVFFSPLLLISHVSFVVIRLSSHSQLDPSFESVLWKLECFRHALAVSVCDGCLLPETPDDSTCDHFMAQVQNSAHPLSYFINLVAELMEAVHDGTCSSGDGTGSGEGPSANGVQRTARSLCTNHNGHVEFRPTARPETQPQTS